MHARIQVLADPLVSLDVPRWVRNLSSTDAGLVQIFETFNAVADKDADPDQNTVWMQERSGRKFKVLTLNPNMPHGILTSTDMTLRLIQPDEMLNQLT
jgi:hypothetical protein